MNISSSDSIIQISGVDSAEFLQGQITNDINFVSENKILTSAICNVKGRVLAVFRILRISSGFLIFVNKSVAEKFKTHLEKYAVFFKTKIEFIDKAIDGIEIISESDWKLNCIERGFVEITESISEVFTPHELNYQNLGLINFEKGCFTGQEVIARMHYRGKLKFSLAKFSVDERNLLKELDFIFNKDGKKLGQVVLEEKNEGLVTLKDKLVTEKDFFDKNLKNINFLNIESI
ncbi:MAG: hypothetical protein VX674_02050 [Pseudomonadota bacterium]|nr:hypothetical protein [Pseudomonadota bacterium]